MATYSKPHLSFDDQLALLKSRGLQVSDDKPALHYLRTVGYYTLGGYLYSMREISSGQGTPERTDTFLTHASFEHMIELYEFDRQLRHLCLEALEVIERAVKVKVAYSVGKADHHAHYTGSALDPSASAARADGTSRHQVWLDKHTRKVADRSHDAIEAFIRKYGPQLPLWVATDAMDFGDISQLLGMLDQSWTTYIAKGFDLLSGPQVISWTRSMCSLRNIAAHHERLWNRKLIDAPMRPKSGEKRHFTELANANQDTWTRPYCAFLVTAYFMRRIQGNTEWSQRMGTLLATLPVGPGVNYAALGAPPTWQTNTFWGLT